MLSCSEDLPTYSELTVSKTDVFIQADGQNPKETVNPKIRNYHPIHD